MAELKTKKTEKSPAEFIEAIADEETRKDCRTLVKMMKSATKAQPRMWGPSIVGFGDYRYRYASGREGDWFRAGFSPRKQALTLYIMSGFTGHEALMKKLGKYKTGKGCLYLKRLADVDQKVLSDLIHRSVKKPMGMA